MTPRIQPAIAKLFDTPNFKGTKREVGEAVHCDPKTAARYLCDMWMHRNIYICGWVREQGAPLPVYAKRTGYQQDAPKPPAKKDIPFLERGVDKIYAQRQARKRLNKVLSGEIRLGVWGL